MTGEIFAVKKVTFGGFQNVLSRHPQIKLGSVADAQEGLNRTALREIKCLQELDHVNVLKVCAFSSSSSSSFFFSADVVRVVAGRRVQQVWQSASSARAVCNGP